MRYDFDGRKEVLGEARSVAATEDDKGRRSASLAITIDKMLSASDECTCGAAAHGLFGAAARQWREFGKFVGINCRQLIRRLAKQPQHHRHARQDSTASENVGVAQ